MQGESTIIYLAFVLVSVLLSMTLHEAMHGFVAYWLGDDTAERHGRLTLNPIAHIDPFATVLLPLILAAHGAPPFGAAKPVPFDPNKVRWGDYGAALVGLAGPLTNLVLGFLGFALFTLVHGSGLLSDFLQVFFVVNIAFFVFNIIPLPPLDGSRVLYAFAPDAARQVMETIERYGLVAIFAVVVLFNAQLGAYMSSAIVAIIHLFSLPFGVSIGV